MPSVALTKNVPIYMQIYTYFDILKWLRSNFYLFLKTLQIHHPNF